MVSSFPTREAEQPARRFSDMTAAFGCQPRASPFAVQGGRATSADSRLMRSLGWRLAARSGGRTTAEALEIAAMNPDPRAPAMR